MRRIKIARIGERKQKRERKEPALLESTTKMNKMLVGKKMEKLFRNIYAMHAWILNGNRQSSRKECE